MTIDCGYLRAPLEDKICLNQHVCQSCSFAVCLDGFPSTHIDCSNMRNMDGPLYYDSCIPERGGVLDVFEWLDSYSLTGCPFSLQVDSMFGFSN